MQISMKTREMNRSDKLPRKVRKVLVERKRRERIDCCLQKIKDLLFAGKEYQNENVKIEKADILEQVLEFIKVQNFKDQSCKEKSEAEYRLGYMSCMKEMSKLIEPVNGQSAVSMSLMKYMDNKLNNMGQISPSLPSSSKVPAATYVLPVNFSASVYVKRDNLNFIQQTVGYYSNIKTSSPYGHTKNRSVTHIKPTPIKMEIDSNTSFTELSPKTENSTNVWRPW